MLTLSANLLLSAFLGLAILNGSKPASKTDAAKAPLTDSTAVQNPDSSIQSASNPSASSQPAPNPSASNQSVSNNEAASVRSVRNGGAGPYGSNPELPGAPAARRLLHDQAVSSAPHSGPDPLLQKKHSTSREAAYIPISELPPPPPAAPVYEPVRMPVPTYFSSAASRNQKYANIRFTGIIGNKAVLSLRRSGTRKKYDTICLAPGEETITADDTVISVQQVEPDRVTFMLGGKKIVQSLPHIH